MRVPLRRPVYCRGPPATARTISVTRYVKPAEETPWRASPVTEREPFIGFHDAATAPVG
jgi:hypothetical protein